MSEILLIVIAIIVTVFLACLYSCLVVASRRFEEDEKDAQ